jgi:hypothetical protein
VGVGGCCAMAQSTDATTIAIAISGRANVERDMDI